MRWDLTPDYKQISDPFDTAEKPCYDQQAIMCRYDVIAEVCDYMRELGWEAYQNDHEDALCQFAMNWKYDDALQTADKHSSFKFMMKSVAEKYGFRTSYMPKPSKGLTGPVAMPISVWSLDGRTNVFADASKELHLSDQGRTLLGGIMQHASALAAICNPTVNSYKRINAPRTSSGRHGRSTPSHGPATTAPTWVRVPGRGRFDLHLPDGAANPYLLQAAIFAAGLDGIRTQANPGKRHDIDMYQMGHNITDAPRLPPNLLDALRDYDRDTTLKSAMCEAFSSGYLKLKRKEWDSCAAHFST